ncbi:breast cancer type 1 susceptibility protein homolog [Mytilus californianus]|uniref:breast cancer type 1 susceptibility protein homolog n=1 Tax=Mytilus californianus TaxID=6549 RepID=UPI002245795B|nr:breast cancer type 1 susceptibility protein homolog [Mytilus californianus]
MVEGVRSLIQAFQEDTGAIFSPPRGLPSMNLTPCTPEPLPCKAARGTKRKIIVDSPKRTENKQNCRQSKRRKSLKIPEHEKTIAETSSKILAIEDQCDLLKYLDQGSCGAESGNSEEKTQNLETSAKQLTYELRKNNVKIVKQNVLLKDITESKNDVTKCGRILTDKEKIVSSETLNRYVDTSKTKEVDLVYEKQKVPRGYSLRSPKRVNYNVESQGKDSLCPTSKSNLYNFSDSPVTPVHLLRHQRDNLQVKQGSQLKMEDNGFKHVKSTNNSLNDTRIRTERVEARKGKELTIGNNRIDSTLSVQKNSQTDASQDQASPDFQHKERQLFTDKTYRRQKNNANADKTYKRERNKASDIQIYSKVNSWLTDNPVSQNSGNREVNLLHGMVENIDVPIEIEEDVDKQNPVLEVLNEKENDKKNSLKGNKENFSEENSAEVKGTSVITSEDEINMIDTIEIDAVDFNNLGIRPLASQKRRIFKSKPTTQTTSVCQKKGVLVIKKVSPTGNTASKSTHQNNVSVEKEAVIDPFEFKSSQKTPVIPESKKIKHVKKQKKDRMKGKLDFMSGNTTNIKQKESIDISDDQHIQTENMAKITKETNSTDQCSLMEDTEKHNGRKQSDILPENTTPVQTAQVVKSLNSNKTDTNSELNIMPGSLDDSTHLGKSKKGARLSNKLKKKKQEEETNKKNIKKLIETINSAEDEDLLTCTQEVLQQMDWREDSNKASSEDIIPDTANMQISLKRRKSVSFASNNIEISGTPRQTRRSVPMVVDKNKGRLLPKETRGKNVQNGKQNLSASSRVQVIKQKKQEIMAEKTKKPFVWEEKDNDSDGSTSTEDLDIHPSQEEFELPYHDVQSQEISRIIENKKDPTQGIPEPQKDPTQGIPEHQKDPTQGIPEPQKDPTQGIPEPQKDPTQGIPEPQKDPTQGIPEHQKDSTQGIPASQKDPTQGIPEPQKHAVVDECRYGQIESQNLSKDTKVRKNEHLSPNRSQLVENLSENTDESVPIIDRNIYVENTQENVDGMQLENEIETMEVQVIPESVDDIIMDAKLEPEPAEMLPPSQNQSSQNNGMHSEDQKLNYEKVLTKQKQKKNMYQSLNVTENNKSPEISSQSTVSTVNETVDSDVPVRKSRSKLRSRKVKSQCSDASNCPIEIQSVVEETPVSNNCQSQLKNVDTLSDTTSQQSVSILLPLGKGDNFNPTGSSESGETVDQTNIKSHIKKTEKNSYSNEIDIDSCIEMIPATESDSMMSLSDHTIKSGKHQSQSSSSASQKRRISTRNSEVKSRKMQEIFPDSDVEIISQPHIPAHLMGTPIVLSGTQTCNEEALEGKVSLERKSAEKNCSNNVEKVLMTVDSRGDSSTCEFEHVDQNKSEEKVKEKEIQQGYLNLDTDDTLPPTLVSQKSLNIRNSAEKKRRSEERQLAYQETKEGRTAKNKLETTESCSPEDIFMMDSEIQSNYSPSLPQNQEGLICLDLEPSEVLTSNLIVERASQKSLWKKNQGTQETENINKTGQFEDKIVVKPLENIDKKKNDLLTPQPESLQIISYIDKESINQGNKLQNHLSVPDKHILSPEKVKTCKGKRTVRGLARKRKRLNQQNNTFSESASEDLDKQKDLNESNNEISDRIKDQTLTSKRICSSPKKLETTSPYRNVIKSPFSSHTDEKHTELTPTKKETMTAQENIPKAHKISPTFTFSPKKPKKAKAVKLSVGTQRLSQKTELQGQNIENDTDVIVHVKLNKFERLLRDNIADTEISEEEEDEIIRQDKLNFSDDLTLLEDDIGDKSKTLTLDLKNQEYLSRKTKPFKDQETSSLVLEIDNIPDSSTPLTGKKISSQVKLNRSGQNLKMKKYEERKSVPDSDHVEYDVDIEASSPLPDIIGKDQYNDNHQDFSSDSEDAVLIKSYRTVHVFDGESKQSKPFSDIEVKDRLDLDDVLEVDTVEPPDEDQMSDDDDVKVVRVKKKRRRIVEDDSDSSNASEDSVTSRHLNNTSSSAFSSQSEPINSQQRNKLESDLERMRREMQEIETQLAADNATNSTRIEREDASTEKTNKLNFSDIGEPNERPDSRNSDVIQEYQSDEELFLSPHPPSPPPLSPQQIEIIEETDFTTEFRKHGLELLPVESSHEKKKRSKVEIEGIEDKELTSPRRSTRSDIDQKHLSVIDQVNNENIPSQIKSSPWKNQLAQISTDNITSKPSKLLYSPLDQRSPQLSPAMERKRQKILSPLVTNTVETKRLKRCFVSTGLVLPQMKELQKLAVLNQCQFCTKFSKDVTHVIVKTEPIGSRVCDRTLKFFKGISQGCWILDYEWVVHSRAAGNLLPEADYEIKGDTVTDDFHFGPMKSRQSTSGPLFDNMQFLVVGDSKGLQKDDLKSLLISCGGQVKCNIEDITDQQHSVVITCSDYDNDSDDEDSPSPDELKLFKEFYVHHGLLSISREWALDSLTVYNLQPVTDYILTPGKISKNAIPNFVRG